MAGLLATIGKGAVSGPGSILPAVVGGGLSLLGGLFGNKSSARQAQAQMAFQERMANTAHQREVADLRAAGLNPILSATGGRGAATPGGAMAPQQDVLTPAVNSALQARRAKAELANLVSNNALLEAQTLKTLTEKNESAIRTNLYNTNQEIAAEDLKGKRTIGEFDETDLGKALRIFERFLGSGSSASGILKNLTR